MSFAFFDLDDTLVDTQTALHAWALEFVAEYGIGDGDDERAAAHVVTRRVRDVDTWFEFAERARDWYGIAAPAQEIFEEFAASYTRKFTISPTVTDGLTRLREAGWLLGIVTNGMTRVQHGKIDQVGLRGYVDVLIDSQSAGYPKPDRRIFELAAGKLGVELGPAGWMVGDMLDKDVEGGIAAGPRTIWLPHGVTRTQGDPEPEFSAASIDEAIAIIEASAE
ncbi:MAG TPA: HAD family hydrolase [Actinospica sp.]|nr:HAD family hydrolase [Actinospica sp.]